MPHGINSSNFLTVVHSCTHHYQVTISLTRFLTLQNFTFPKDYCFNWHRPLCVGRDSSDGIAIGYGLDGPGIESLWGIFSAPVQAGLVAHPASYTMGLFWGVKRPGRDADHPPPSSAEVNPLTPELNPSAQRCLPRLLLGVLIFKGLTALRLYKTFGVNPL
jgi:hypothetical protein